jgi:hypothetical protein
MNNKEWTELWNNISSDIHYIAATYFGKIKGYEYKPRKTEVDWEQQGKEWLFGLDHPLAQFVIEYAVKNGWENSLFERSKNKIKAWNPDREDIFYVPTSIEVERVVGYFYSVYDQRKLKCINRGLAFESPKYAHWVLRHRLNPLILQAAIAVNGLASYEQMKEDKTYKIDNFALTRYTAVYYTQYYEKKYQSTSTPEIEINEIPKDKLEFNAVNFTNWNKAYEALKVILPDGNDLQTQLENEIKEDID